MKKKYINNAIKIDGLTFANEEMKTAIMINIVILQSQWYIKYLLYIYIFLKSYFICFLCETLQ